MSVNLLAGLAGGARGASSGLSGLISILEKAKDDKRSDARYAEERDYRTKHDAEDRDYRERHDVLSLLQTGRFRLRKVLDDAAADPVLEADPNRPDVYGDNDPNAPMQPAPKATGRTAAERALSLADIEAIPQDELEAKALRDLDAARGSPRQTPAVGAAHRAGIHR
jgi:hypothetical protein